MYAALGSASLSEVLGELSISAEALTSAITPMLRIDAPPSIRIATVSSDRTEIYRYGASDQIQGRAEVLAAVPREHKVDALDIFVAALLDPRSLTSRIVAIDAHIDRDDLLVKIARVSGRYNGVRFPRTVVIALQDPLRAPWDRRDDVLVVIRDSLSDEVYWTYVRRDDEIHVLVQEGVDISSVAAAIVRRLT